MAGAPDNRLTWRNWWAGNNKNGDTSAAPSNGQRRFRTQIGESNYQAPGAYGHAPGPSKGLLRWIRDRMGGWMGPRTSRETAVAEWVAQEKARSGPLGITFPWFLPYVDDYTAETPTIRLAYRRMLADPNIKAALLGKLFGVASLDLTTQPANKKNKRDQEISEFTHWNLTERLKGGVPEMIWSILSGGLVDGYSVCEKVWEPEEWSKWDGKWVLGKLKPKDVGNDLVLQTDDKRNIIGIMGLRYNAGIEFSPADFLIYRYLPLFDTPTGMSDLRAAYSRYWMLDTVMKLRAIAAEKRALPFLIGTFQNATQQPTLETMLAAAKSQNWAAVPEGVRVEAQNWAGTSESIYQSFVKDLKHDIFLAIQGAILQTLEGETTDGRGNSQVHKSTSDLWKWFIAQTVQSLLNDRDSGLVRDIVDLNYAVQEYPKCSLSSVDINELQAELQVFTGLLQSGLPLSKEQAYERFNWNPPNPDDPDDALKMQQQQQQPGGGMPGGMGGLPGGQPPTGPQPGGNPAGPGPAPDQGGGPGEDQAIAQGLEGLGFGGSSGGPAGGGQEFDDQNLFTAPMKKFEEKPASGVAGDAPFRFSEGWRQYIGAR